MAARRGRRQVGTRVSEPLPAHALDYTAAQSAVSITRADMATDKHTKIADAEATREVCRELETAVGLLSKADPDPEMWPEGRQPHKRERTFIDLATASDVEWPTVMQL
ncbi:hypothetical protein BMF94_5326 [Rhodotorula taiwanensis]|uniref:Uncharacterized protein n=1 Tax=Rhodotorula taiwanensis TaxID=741276 RepID=A0A2S5B4C2_9BASI|nr:hypothetical protein BMF94_5326 [Rhodotorula taiwanensis]